MSPVESRAHTAPGTLLVVIGARHIESAVLQGHGAQARWQPGSQRQVVIDAAQGIESTSQALVAALQCLQAEPALPPVQSVRVLVADGWLALAAVPWSARLLRADSAQSFARAQLQAAGFELQGDDKLKIDDAPFAAPRLVVAYPATLLSALAQWAQRLNARLASVQALSLAAWAWAGREVGMRPRALAVMDAGLMLVGRVMTTGHPRLTDVTVRALEQGGAPTMQQVCGLWQRLCLREPELAAVEQVALLDLCGGGGLVPAVDQPFVRVHLPTLEGAAGVSGALRLAAAVRAWPDPLDAMPGAATPSAWRWPVLAGATLLAAALLWQAMLAKQALRAASERWEASSGVPQVIPVAPSWSREEQARVQAVNVAIRELNLPIAQLLRALEPPRDIAVAVLSVEQGAGTSASTSAVLKVSAEARTGEDMARYVAFVATRKPFTGAYLTRHDLEQGLAEPVYRFTVEATWAE